jgi:hypothetical protein
MLVAVMIAASTEATAQLIVRKDSVAIARRAELEKEKVIVGEDTVSVILPERNFGRYDRGLYNYLFIPKGKWAIGLTASYYRRQPTPLNSHRPRFLRKNILNQPNHQLFHTPQPIYRSQADILSRRC